LEGDVITPNTVWVALRRWSERYQVPVNLPFEEIRPILRKLEEEGELESYSGQEGKDRDHAGGLEKKDLRPAYEREGIDFKPFLKYLRKHPRGTYQELQEHFNVSEQAVASMLSEFSDGRLRENLSKHAAVYPDRRKGAYQYVQKGFWQRLLGS